jgi:hypothetical protein
VPASSTFSPGAEPSFAASGAGRKHPRSGASPTSRGEARSQSLVALPRYVEARADAEAALAIRRAKLPPDAPAVVHSLVHAGLAEYALHNAESVKTNRYERAPRAWPDGGTDLTHVRAVIGDPEAALRPKSRWAGPAATPRGTTPRPCSRSAA